MNLGAANKEASMMSDSKDSALPLAHQKAINRITVCGFKSISQEQSIEVRPLTILAGANSSGKSSIMQPLLLLKQTLEATYDPGALRLDGPNVRFTSAEQLLSRIPGIDRAGVLCIGAYVGHNGLVIRFQKQVGGGFDILETDFSRNGDHIRLQPEMTHAQIAEKASDLLQSFQKATGTASEPELRIMRNRCLLNVGIVLRARKGSPEAAILSVPDAEVESAIRELIHLPGLRGNPERTYPVTAVGRAFPGTFQDYTASAIAQWAKENDKKLNTLWADLKLLGLTWKVVAEPINDTQVELKVGRLPHASRGGARDIVNVADVGFGVSQTLPVLVALLIAHPGQLVYLEQPEIHLHPRAQVALASVLADAAVRGVRVVAETHSSLLLLGVQALVAEGKLDPGLVKLHWFTRQEDGSTIIASADLDEAGRFGDWPEDFGTVELHTQGRYLKASASRQRAGYNGETIETPGH